MLSRTAGRSGRLRTQAARVPVAAWVTLHVGLLLNLPIVWRRAGALPASNAPPYQAAAVASEVLLVLSLTGLIGTLSRC